jgi:hypothetical protein
MMSGPGNKQDFYRRWLRGEFGNHPHAWTSPEDLARSGYSGLLSVRSLTPGGRMETGVTVQDAMGRPWQGGVVFQQVMPDQDLVIQGSLSDVFTGLSLEYCLEPNVNFRQAMTMARRATGLNAVLILRQFVDPASLEDLYELIDRFPNAVIEFATFRRLVGVCPHRRTVIFEIREY